VYIAGGIPYRLALGVHDDIWARSIVIESDDARIALVSLDLIGINYDDVVAIRRQLADTLAFDYVLIAATHSHNAPDVLGFWAPDLFCSDTLYRGIMGTRKLYDFVNDNPLVEFHPSEYTNDPFVIAQNDKMIAINGAIEVDITGQVCADSIGTRFYSGIGGQVDFIRGAARSRGGKPIIALPATAKNGSVSRIVPTLKPGAGVVTSRGDVHYVVTEFGTAFLHGKSIRERAMALIQIADPKFRPCRH